MKTTIQNPVIDQTLKSVLNSNETLIQIKWNSVDQKSRHAFITVNYKLGKNKGTFEIEAFINPNLYDWLTLKRNIKIDDTSAFKFQTGYQRFLSKIGINQDTKVTAIEFKSIPNNLPDYYANPFEITCNQDGIWSVSLVNNVPARKIARVDLSTGEEKLYYIPKRNSDGTLKFKAPQFFKRINIA
jgi:hypothetical protein